MEALFLSEGFQALCIFTGFGIMIYLIMRGIKLLKL